MKGAYMSIITIGAKCDECYVLNTLNVDAHKAVSYFEGKLNTVEVLGDDWNPSDSEILIHNHRIRNNMWNNYYLCNDCWHEHLSLEYSEEITDILQEKEKKEGSKK
jgi:hypothetical protein